MDLPHGKVSTGASGGCWVCEALGKSFNAHHIIPRNAGGTKGPQVRICSECHDGIHHVAKLGVSADDYVLVAGAKSNWKSQEARERANFLVNLIITSESLANKSTNKSVMMNLKLTGEQNQKLEYLSKRLAKNKVDTLLHLLDVYTPTGKR